MKQPEDRVMMWVLVAVAFWIGLGTDPAGTWWGDALITLAATAGMATGVYLVELLKAGYKRLRRRSTPSVS